MISKAIIKKVSIAPRKARLVVDLIRGKEIKVAKAILMFTPKSASSIVLKLLNSAEANLAQNINLKSNDFYISEVYVNEGIRLKRLFPRAKGSGDMIKKRTSHIVLKLSMAKEIKEEIKAKKKEVNIHGTKI
ncbi:50S ribosomal protein L22 [Candidatus Phytoplasma mali]|uniref:Large ribosomal subunit protein uL22 n=7 Tax=cellular organisms TaxID=131567 RepID=RL22_PHYMT|nr:50S ribosomal protein L22 [Candidatus Phytoplasma mali]B3QZZ6.1 RecName: Full=Large ribosomal subunit protein uL22; AltName: Full=50S ribosomal protein L22 [Candidatus Phytoplasma mali AT]AMQ81136.1 50S ribosomal protein L22 [Candidatus Phytoplasma mali]CAP18533.1 50S ribosomal protein L22 [Candidatus Phytoplasma mali]